MANIVHMNFQRFFKLPGLRRLAAWVAFCTLPAAMTAQSEATVAIFSINDFHGAFIADGRKDIPGAAALWQTLDSLKEVYPYHITVAAGDNFGGSYFYQATRGTLLPVLFDGLDIHISAIGNHEFDDGQTALAAKWADSPLRPKNWKLDYVCANVRDASGKVPSFAQPFAIQPIHLKGNKTLNVAFVGLLTSTTPLQTSASKVKGLAFDGRYDRVLDSIKRIPEFASVRSAQIRLLLTHIGTKMENGIPVWDDPNGACLQQLNDTTWHGILSAHSHQPVCGNIGKSNYPVVQGKWHGNYISILKIRVDTLTMKVTGITPELCPVREKGRLSQGAARFQAQIDSVLQHATTAGGTPLGKELTCSPADIIHERTDKWRQTAMGELVCEAYAEAYRKAAGLDAGTPIIGISHFGSIRAGFNKGKVTVLDVGEALPFANALRVYKLTGKQLRSLIDFGLHNQQYGWLQTGWLQTASKKDGHVTSLYYTGQNGKRLSLADDKDCFIVTDEFITTGGDGYLPELFPSRQEIRVGHLPKTTDAFIQYLDQFEVLPVERLREYETR